MYLRVSSGVDKIQTDVDTSVVCFYQVSFNLQLFLQIDFKLIVNVLDYRLKAKQIQQSFKMLTRAPTTSTLHLSVCVCVCVFVGLCMCTQSPQLLPVLFVDLISIACGAHNGQSQVDITLFQI